MAPMGVYVDPELITVYVEARMKSVDWIMLCTSTSRAVICMPKYSQL
jgi:hypothetical protein